MDLKKKKYIGVVVITIVLLVISWFAYGELRGKVLNKEYMKNIYVEDNTNEKANTDKEVVAESRTIIVEIKGEVAKPDVYELPEGAIIKDLIDIAGGLTKDANINDINRAKKLENHELIIINNKNVDNNLGREINSKSELININTADIKELQELDGIGESKAQKIIDFREKNGRFKTKEDLKNVSGIGDKLYEGIENKITV